MNPDSIQVRFGELEDVIGHARRHDDIAIVPARVRLTGNVMTNGSHLEDYLGAYKVSADIKGLIHPGEDAPWVCGRVQRVFSLPQVPEEDRAEKSCMGFSFLAAIAVDGALVGIPFECTDYYGRSVLLFSGDAPPKALMDRVASAFWQILLGDPNDLPEYTDRFSHLGGGFEVQFGVQDGEPFMKEVAE
jgi:hypothetical protein